MGKYLCSTLDSTLTRFSQGYVHVPACNRELLAVVIAVRGRPLSHSRLDRKGPDLEHCGPLSCLSRGADC